MYLRYLVKAKFLKLHLIGRNPPLKIHNFEPFDHRRKPRCRQDWFLACSKAQIKNWKRNKVVLIHVYQTLFTTKNKGKLFLVTKSSGPLLARMSLKSPKRGRTPTKSRHHVPWKHVSRLLTECMGIFTAFSPSCYAVLMSSKKSETAVYGCNPVLLKFY